MSRVYFDSPEGCVELSGSERALLGSYARDIALGLLTRSSVHDLRRHIQPKLHGFGSAYLGADPLTVDIHRWRSSFDTWFRVDGAVEVYGNVIPTIDLSLNTLVALGSDVLGLAAHIHGSCESHAFIEAEDGYWLAETIERGLAQSIFRDKLNGYAQGWDEVADLARKVADTGNGPIVTSFSVCETFPHQSIEGMTWEPPVMTTPDGKHSEPAYDAWYDLSADERWDLGVKAIRERDFTRRISPYSVVNQGYLTGVSVFDLMDDMYSKD